MSWALLFGYLSAGIISQFLSKEFVARHLGGNGFYQIFKSSILGVPLPLCSCGVLPVAESFKKIGVGRGALTSFIISTPQIGVDSIAVTYGMMGPFFAIFRPFAAFISGIVGGVAVEKFSKDPVSKSEESPKCSCCSHDSIYEKEHEKKMAEENFFAKITKVIKYGFGTMMEDTAKSLVVGLLVGALLNILIPESIFEEIGGVGQIIEMLAMIAFGIPLYVCASASVPVAAVLIAKGISPGAAFVFLMTGPASNTVSLAFVTRLIGARGFFCYISSLIVCALAFGFLMNLFPVEISSSGLAHCAETEQISLFQNVGGVLLSLLIGIAIIKRQLKGDSK